MCIYIYTYICIYVCTYIYIYTCMRTRTHILYSPIFANKLVCKAVLAVYSPAASLLGLCSCSPICMLCMEK